MWHLVKHLAFSVLISSNTQASTQHEVQAQPQQQPQAAVVVVGVEEKDDEKPIIFRPQ